MKLFILINTRNNSVLVTEHQSISRNKETNNTPILPSYPTHIVSRGGRRSPGAKYIRISSQALDRDHMGRKLHRVFHQKKKDYTGSPTPRRRYHHMVLGLNKFKGEADESV